MACCDPILTIRKSTLVAIADSIREKNGTTELIKVIDLDDEIDELPTSGLIVVSELPEVGEDDCVYKLVKDGTIQYYVYQETKWLNLNTGDIDDYEGSYELTPQAEEQVIQTANKRLIGDITIAAIPYEEELNDSDGMTVTIA